jgi:hypothetical protein
MGVGTLTVGTHTPTVGGVFNTTVGVAGDDSPTFRVVVTTVDGFTTRLTNTGLLEADGFGPMNGVVTAPIGGSFGLLFGVGTF